MDIIEIRRIEQAVRRWGQRFLAHVYTEAELAYCCGRVHELAARFAGKEALAKALGTGVWSSAGICWRDLEILPDGQGKPQVHLHGQAQGRAAELGLHEIAISLSHSHDYTVAFVVAQ